MGTTQNLLAETRAVLGEHGLGPGDVLWVGNSRASQSWEQFAAQADFEYDDGFGGVEINLSLVVVGRDWWLERREYDGAEEWEYRTFPARPAAGPVQLRERFYGGLED